MDKKIFYIMAPGKSINDISDDEWKYLEDKNTISFSQFPFANKKTMYHFSYEDHWSDTRHLNHIKRNGFMDTHMLLGLHDTINYAKELGFKNISPIIKGPGMGFNGKPWSESDKEPPCKFSECRAYRFRHPLFRFRGSLTAVINAALILKANEIRLVGVDLDSQYYFFDEQRDRWIKEDNDKLVFDEILANQTHSIEKRKRVPTTNGISYNPEIENDTNIPYLLSNNIILRGVLDTIIWMDKELRDEGLDGIYTTNKKSNLYGKLQYKEIMDE